MVNENAYIMTVFLQIILKNVQLCKGTGMIGSAFIILRSNKVDFCIPQKVHILIQL